MPSKKTVDVFSTNPKDLRLVDVISIRCAQDDCIREDETLRSTDHDILYKAGWRQYAGHNCCPDCVKEIKRSRKK